MRKFVRAAFFAFAFAVSMPAFANDHKEGDKKEDKKHDDKKHDDKKGEHKEHKH